MTEVAESLMDEMAVEMGADTHTDRRLTDQRMDGHEALCLVRHDTLLEMIGALGKRMGRLEAIIIACAGAVIACAGTVIAGLAIILWWAFQQFAALVIHVPSAVQ